MKDFMGNVLMEGNTIVYARRQSSSMWLNRATIITIEHDRKGEYGQPYDRVLVQRVEDPADKKRREDRNVRWKKTCDEKGYTFHENTFREKVWLRVPEYIVKVAE